MQVSLGLVCYHPSSASRSWCLYVTSTRDILGKIPTQQVMIWFNRIDQERPNKSKDVQHITIATKRAKDYVDVH